MNNIPTTTPLWRNINQLRIGWHMLATVMAFSMIFAIVSGVI